MGTTNMVAFYGEIPEIFLASIVLKEIRSLDYIAIRYIVGAVGALTELGTRP